MGVLGEESQRKVLCIPRTIDRSLMDQVFAPVVVGVGANVLGFKVRMVLLMWRQSC